MSNWTSLKLPGADARQTPTVIVDHVINQHCRLVGRQQTVAHAVAEDCDRRRRAEADRAREERRIVVVDGHDVAVRLRDDDRCRLAEVTTVTRASAKREPYALDLDDRQRA